MTRAEAKQIALKLVGPKTIVYRDPYYPCSEFLLGFRGAGKDQFAYDARNWHLVQLLPPEQFD